MAPREFGDNIALIEGTTTSSRLSHHNISSHQKDVKNDTSNPKTVATSSSFANKSDCRVISRGTCCYSEGVYDEVELLNAFTMLSPVFVSLHFMVRCESWSIFLAALQFMIHSPCSMLHHLNLGLGDPKRGQKGKGLVYRRLDYTGIQMDSLCLAFLLSKSPIISALTVVLNSYFILMIWLDKERPQGPNLIHHAFGGCLVVLAIISRGQYVDAMLAFFGFYLCFDVFYFERIGKYSHALMHIFLGVPQFFIIVASAPENMFTSFWIQNY